MDARVLVLAPLIAAVLSACAPEPDFVTRSGVTFRLNGSTSLTQQDAEEQEDAYFRDVAAMGAYDVARTRECVRRAIVDIVPSGKFPCAADPSQRCAGEQYGSLLKVAASECRHDSAYVHELHHWVQECIDGTADYAHLGPSWRVIEVQQAHAARRCKPETPPTVAPN